LTHEAPFYEKVEKLYGGLANQLVNQGHVLDNFASAFDQVGVAKMKATVERTGVLVLLSESLATQYSMILSRYYIFQDVQNVSPCHVCDQLGSQVSNIQIVFLIIPPEWSYDPARSLALIFV
ncbi:unnamed protein product, partial [Brassica rapa subsp. narinosa]